MLCFWRSGPLLLDFYCSIYVTRSTSELRVMLVQLKLPKPSSHVFYGPFQFGAFFRGLILLSMFHPCLCCAVLSVPRVAFCYLCSSSSLLCRSVCSLQPCLMYFPLSVRAPRLPLFCYALLCVHSSFALLVLKRERKLVA